MLELVTHLSQRAHSMTFLRRFAANVVLHRHMLCPHVEPCNDMSWLDLLYCNCGHAIAWHVCVCSPVASHCKPANRHVSATANYTVLLHWAAEQPFFAGLI